MLLQLLMVDVAGFSVGARQHAPLSRVQPRTTAPLMQGNTWPPPLDAVHVFKIQIGDDEAPLAVKQVAAEKRAMFALWSFVQANEEGGGAARLAQTDAKLRAQLGMAEGSPMYGAFLGGVDREEHGLALVRLEEEERDQKVMIIDAVLISPAVPKQIRPSLRTAVVRSLRAIGEANQMNVRLLADYGV